MEAADAFANGEPPFTGYGAAKLDPQDPSAPAARTPYGNPAPASKERKFKGAKAAAGFASAVGYNALTEVRDSVKAVWKNIPPDQRMFYGSPSLLRMMADILLNWNKVQMGPWKWVPEKGPPEYHGGAMWDLAANAVQDAAYGALGKAGAKSAQLNNMSTTPTRGTAAGGGYSGASEMGAKDPISQATDAILGTTEGKSRAATVRQTRAIPGPKGRKK